MPFLLPILGLGALIGVVNLTTKANGDSILTPAQESPNALGLPSWVIPTVVVGVGGLLLFKYGKKLLKV